jgi:hypothetical protein
LWWRPECIAPAGRMQGKSHRAEELLVLPIMKARIERQDGTV